ncbi:MAG TPA: hypothetical protein VL020_01820 [Pseudomonadales bacterium]|nr:hypothetical protein [Pseudomonadales bacterium]
MSRSPISNNKNKPASVAGFFMPKPYQSGTVGTAVVRLFLFEINNL